MHLSINALLPPHALVCSDFGAHPPWNTIIVVGGTVNFLLLWLLTHVASLWVGFPMWMWGGRALIIQVLAQMLLLHSSWSHTRTSTAAIWQALKRALLSF